MRRIIAALATAALFGCSERPAPAGNTANRAADATRNGGSESAVASNTVLFLGTSLTAGYGVGADAAFPALVQQRISADSLPFTVSNAGISGETSAGGLRRIDWLLQNPVDVLVLELGANDGLRALDVDSLKSNLDIILARTRATYPDAAIIIAGMQAPPNLGPPYTARFQKVYPDLASKYDATLIPFLLNGVAGVPRLNQEDGIHPNPEGHRMIAESVWAVLRPVLVERGRAKQ